MDFKSFFNYENGKTTYGLTNELIAFYLLELFKETKQNIILVASNLYESNNIYNALKIHTDNVELFPMDDFITSKIVAISPEFTLGRLNVLEKLQAHNLIIVTNLMGYLKYLPSVKEESILKIKVDDNIDRNELIKRLDDYGYNRESLVTTTGEYSIRGFIIDIYLINELHPIRIELFGDTIESIRYFDENTQRTMEEIKEISLKPFKEVETNQKSSLFDYTNKGIVVYLNRSQIDAAYQKLGEEIAEYQESNQEHEKYMFELSDINPSYELYIDNINNPTDIVSHEIPNFKENFELLKDTVYKWEKEKKDVYFYLSKPNEVKTIKSLIPSAKIINKKLNKGFIYNNIVCIRNSILELRPKPIRNIKIIFI